jgi:hypothetical protein
MVFHYLETYAQKIIQKLSSLRNWVVPLTLLLTVQGAFAANIVLTPQTITTKVGKTFTLDVLVNNNQDAINAVSSLISFPKDVLSVSSLSKSGTIINMWAEEPSYSNAEGTISFEGVTLNPGFSGASGKIVTITFKAKQAGNINVSIKSGQVLANDGNATNVLGTTAGAFVVINEDTAPLPKENVVTTPVDKVPTAPDTTPVITSSSYPDSEAWYNKKDASFEWKIPEDVTAVRTLYGTKEESNPTKVYDPPINNRAFTVDTDGVMYMHVQFKNGSSWGKVSHYKFQVDTAGPETLKASFPDGIITSNPTPTLLVQAEDTLSGISGFSISVDKQDAVLYPLDPSNLYKIPKAAPGKHTVTINALDKAGNTSSVSIDYTIQNISPPVITEYTKKVDFDNPLKVSGTTYPLTVVEVSLTDEDGKVETTTTTSGDTGGFSAVWSKKIATGVYEMRARVIDTKSAVSAYTESRPVIVDHVALIRAGIFVMNWLSVFLIIILSVTLVLATFWYSFVQFARFRRKVRRQMLEAEHTLKINVVALKKDTEEFKTILEKAEKKRELTKEEQSILKRFKKRIDTTEKEIEQKLESIG